MGTCKMKENWPKEIEDKFKERKIDELRKLGFTFSPFEYDFVFSHIPVGPLTQIKRLGEKEFEPFEYEKIFSKPQETTFYIHIPFCARKCKYCYFIKWSLAEERKERKERKGNYPTQKKYIDLLKKELEILSEYFKYWDKITSIYIGGGTPSALDEEYLKQLFEEIVEPLRKKINKTGLEIAMELHPETMNEKKFEIMKKYGVSRLSFGIQTFNKNVLEEMGRSNKNYEQTIKWIEEYEFNNWNLDMIYGLPKQDSEIIREDVNKILEIGPPSITWYQLWFAPRKKDREILLKTYRKEDFLSEDGFIKAKIFIHEKLTQNGYQNWSGDWYVKKPENYTKYEEYKIRALGNIGIGIGIYQYYNGYIFENAAEYEEYKARIEAGILPIRWYRKMHEHEIFVREMIMGLKGLNKPLGINEKRLEEYANKNNQLAEIKRKIEFLTENEPKVFRKENDEIKLQEKYWLIRDYIIYNLFKDYGWTIEKEGIPESRNGISIYEAKDIIIGRKTVSLIRWRKKDGRVSVY